MTSQQLKDAVFNGLTKHSKERSDANGVFSAAAHVVSHLNFEKFPQTIEEAQEQLRTHMREEAIGNYDHAHPATSKEIESGLMKSWRQKYDAVQAMDFNQLLKTVDDNARVGYGVVEKIVLKLAA